MNAEEARRLTREFRESEDAELYKLIKEAAQNGYNYIKLHKPLSDGQRDRLEGNGYKVKPEWSDGGSGWHKEVIGHWISWE